MITTLVFFSVVAISDLAFVEHAVIVGGFVARFGLHIHALEVSGHGNASAGITDQIPSDEVFIAAVKGIGERSLNRVRSNEIEELWGFLLHRSEHGILIGSRELCEWRAF